MDDENVLWKRESSTDNSVLADEIEDLVKELLQEQPALQTKSSRNANSNWESGRCVPVYLGGSSLQVGVSRKGVTRACSRLRCASCDLPVTTFTDCRWSSNMDYLFLRNHAPHGKALRDRLLDDPGARAYACQCRWLSMDETQMATPSSFGLRWFCGEGKHSDF